MRLCGSVVCACVACGAFGAYALQGFMGFCEGRAALAKFVIRKFVMRSENVLSDTF